MHKFVGAQYCSGLDYNFIMVLYFEVSQNNKRPRYKRKPMNWHRFDADFYLFSLSRCEWREKWHCRECCLRWIESHTPREPPCQWHADLWCLLCVLGQMYVLHSDSGATCRSQVPRAFSTLMLRDALIAKPLKILNKWQLYKSTAKCIAFYAQAHEPRSRPHLFKYIAFDMPVSARQYLKWFKCALGWTRGGERSRKRNEHRSHNYFSG